MEHRQNLHNLIIAFFVAVFSFLTLLLTVKEIGMVWDEPAYMKASQSYSNWVYIFAKDPMRALQTDEIDNYFETNHEHPPVAKIWSGVFWGLTKKITDQLTAFRIGPMLLAAILMAFLYYWIAEKFGRVAGLFAAATLITMPRFFFHSHLSALDVPVTVMSFIATFVFWKTIDKKRWAWGILSGFVWGLAVGTKLNGIFIFLAFLLWVLIFRRNWKSVFRLVITGFSAILTFFLIWPWLYHDTWNRVIAYVMYHINHYAIGQWYLGEFYIPPPWHAVFLILWAVVPLITILLFGFGLFQAKKGKNDGGLVWLLIISAIVSILPFAFGKSLLYDDDRLFMPVYPYIAALAGIGFAWFYKKVISLLEKSKKFKLQWLVPVILGILFIAPQVFSIIKYYPHLLSYYSEGVGGLKGATNLGMETTYWCETYGETLDYINKNAKDHDIIWAECDNINAYKQFGMLRSNVFCVDTFTPDANWFLFQYRQSEYGKGGAESYPAYQYLHGKTPIFEINIDGVPLLDMYHQDN